MSRRHAHLVWIGAGALGLAGACHFILDPDRFNGFDEPDAMPEPDAPPPPDAGPPDAFVDNLMLSAVTPASVPEGLGSSEVGPRAIIVLSGVDIADNAVLTVEDPTIEVVETQVSSDHTQMAAVLRIPVDPALAKGMTRMVTLTVTQPRLGDGATDAGFIMATQPLVIDGLAEFEPAPGAVMTSSKLDDLYSRASFSGAVTLRGAEPARVRVTGDITIMPGATLDASGGGLGTVGSGGCDGGGQSTSGDCGASGGRGGPSLAAGLTGNGPGGGGGGASAMGEEGGGADSGDGGDAVPVEKLAELGGANGARGHGGGGGGQGRVIAGGLGGAGGSGGAGGGVIELTASGKVVVGADVSANGGAGAVGASCGGLGAGGGGGGGSGGALLVRGLGGLTLGMEVALRATGGLGGPATNSCPKGGDGAPGWIRIDAPEATVANLDADPGVIRGPMWVAPPPIVRSATVDLDLVGAPNTMYGLSVGTGNLTPVQTGTGGTQKLTGVVLDEGANQVCLWVSPSLTNLLPEAGTCVTIVYLP